MLNDWPALTLAGATTVNVAAGAGLTMTTRSPAMAGVVAWAAVVLCVPALISVAANVERPSVSVAFDGRTTPGALSVVVKCSVPAYAVSVLPNWSCAVAVKGKLTPAIGAAVVASNTRVAVAARTSRVTVVVRPPGAGT